MKYLKLFLFAASLSACSNSANSDSSFKSQYVATFVAACSKNTGGSEMMTNICTCQANMIVENMKPSDTADKVKVRAFVVKTAAPECARKAMEGMKK